MDEWIDETEGNAHDETEGDTHDETKSESDTLKMRPDSDT